MNQLVRLPEVTDVTTLSKASIYRLLKKGCFPAPVRIGERRVAWRLSDVMGWLDQRAGAAA
jgi:prophage regulatory protein